MVWLFKVKISQNTREDKKKREGIFIGPQIKEKAIRRHKYLSYIFIL
jgi:hypothetical protein